MVHADVLAEAMGSQNSPRYGCEDKPREQSEWGCGALLFPHRPLCRAKRQVWVLLAAEAATAAKQHDVAGDFVAHSLAPLPRSQRRGEELSQPKTTAGFFWGVREYYLELVSWKKRREYILRIKTRVVC